MIGEDDVERGAVLKTSSTPSYDDSSHRSRATRSSLSSGTAISGRTTSNPRPKAPVRIAVEGRGHIADRVAGRCAAGVPSLLCRDGESVEIEDLPHARLHARHAQAQSAGCGL